MCSRQGLERDEEFQGFRRVVQQGPNGPVGGKGVRKNKTDREARQTRHKITNKDSGAVRPMIKKPMSKEVRSTWWCGPPCRRFV